MRIRCDVSLGDLYRRKENISLLLLIKNDLRIFQFNSLNVSLYFDSGTNEITE